MARSDPFAGDLPPQFGRCRLLSSVEDAAMAGTRLASFGGRRDEPPVLGEDGMPRFAVDGDHAPRLIDEAKLMMRPYCSKIATVFDAGAVEVVP
jgi:hypothetical protein